MSLPEELPRNGWLNLTAWIAGPEGLAGGLVAGALEVEKNSHRPTRTENSIQNPDG